MFLYAGKTQLSTINYHTIYHSRHSYYYRHKRIACMLYGHHITLIYDLMECVYVSTAGPYTYSKRYTEWNTWIGSLVGAIPPVMGYAAATGGVVMAGEPLALASLLFLWQVALLSVITNTHLHSISQSLPLSYMHTLLLCNDNGLLYLHSHTLSYSSHISSHCHGSIVKIMPEETSP